MGWFKQNSGKKTVGQNEETPDVDDAQQQEKLRHAEDVALMTRLLIEKNRTIESLRVLVADMQYIIDKTKKDYSDLYALCDSFANDFIIYSTLDDEENEDSRAAIGIPSDENQADDGDTSKIVKF